MPAARQDQQEEDGYNEEEREWGDGDVEEEEEEDGDDDVIRVGPRTSRHRGCPSDRLRAALNRVMPQCYAHFGIILPDDLTPEER